MSQQCPFCQLIANPQQLLVVGETDNFYAWLEVNPRVKGHTMIVPKDHTESLLDLEPGEYQEAMKLTREVVEKATEGLGADGVSITMNVEEAGGQMLPHAYIQVFPRFQEDENAGTPTGAIFPQKEELKAQLEDIQEKMETVTADFGGGKAKEPHPESQRFKEEMRKERKEEPEDESDEETEEKGSRIVDRDELERDQEDKDGEPQERETEEDEVEGQGHWDGKSFEWR